MRPPGAEGIMYPLNLGMLYLRVLQYQALTRCQHTNPAQRRASGKAEGCRGLRANHTA